MERQRVVHFAKTRTAKVLRPGVTNRGASSQTTVTSDLPHAPLASIDSDFAVITKRRDETNMAPNLWDQIRTSVQQTNDSIPEIYHDSAVFNRAHSNSEQNDYTPPRTYLKLRSTQNIDFQTDCPGSGEDIKLTFVDIQNQTTQEQSRASPDNGHWTRCAGKSSSTRVQDTQNVSFSEDTCHANFPCTQKQSNEKDNSISYNVLNRTNGHTDGSIKQTVDSKLLSQTASTPNVFRKSNVQNLSNITTTSKYGPQNPPSCFQSSLDIKPGQVIVHKANQADMSNDSVIKKVDITSQTNPGKVNTVGNSTPNLPKPAAALHQNKSHREKTTREVSRKENFCSVTVPETDVPFKCLQDYEEPLPEMSSISESVYTSNIRLASERIALTYAKRTHQSMNSSVCLPVYKNTRLCSSINNAQNNMDLQKDFWSLTNVNQGSKHKDSSDVSHQKARRSNNSEYILDPDSKSFCKRNPLRLATHGYSSVSDAIAFECPVSAQTRDLEISNNSSSFTGSLDRCKGVHLEKCLENSCSNGPKSVSAHNRNPRFEVVRKNMKNANDPEEDSKISGTSESSTLQKPWDSQENSAIKRLSFKLATSGIPDVWLIDNDVCELSNTSYSERNSFNNNKIRKTEETCPSFAMDYVTTKKSVKASGTDSGIPISRSGDKHSSHFDKYDHEEQLRKLKRRSLMLATRSLSDLTFLDDEYEYKNFPQRQYLEPNDPRTSKDFSVESVNSRIFHTPDYHIRRHRDDSISSDQHNSSVGSFYSCQSLDFAKTKPSQNRNVDNHTAQLKHNTDSLLTHNDKDFGDSVDSDSSISADTSVYYTASDNSYLTAERTSNTSPFLRHTIVRSSRPQLHDQWRRSPCSNHNQKLPQNKIDLYRVPRKANTLPYKQTPSKNFNSNPINVFHCYGCGLNDGYTVQMKQLGRKNNTKEISNRSRIWVNPDYVPGRRRHIRKRSQSAPSTRRAQTRNSDAPLKHLFPANVQARAEPNVSPNDSSSFIGVPRSSTSGSATSIFLDPTWQAMPRIPPSLGRPRRKLYAGFDSQPLPMDSFLSDSSSVYSTQSSSSWSTSRSATIEGNSRTPEQLSKARSVSSIASSIITPTRPVSQSEVFDFFTYTDKRSSVRENNHNLYLGSDNSFVDDCFKENLYDKTYSKESLESFLSDGTTVNVEQYFNTDSNSDYVKTLLNSPPGGTNFHNNIGDVQENAMQFSEKHNFARLNNSCGSEFGPRSSRNSNCFRSADFENSKNQLKTLKGSSSVSLPRPKFLSKRKYFSTKDIFDLVMTSDKTHRDSKGRSRSLERQAQKMCEVILCLH